MRKQVLFFMLLAGCLSSVFMLSDAVIESQASDGPDVDEDRLPRCVVPPGHPFPGRLPYRIPPYNPYFYPYYPYYSCPKEEKSPYEGLTYKTAGELSLRVAPASALVRVDGYEIPRGSDNLYTISLITGTHGVEVVAEGFQPYEAAVKIETGKRKNLNIQLKK